MRVGIVENPLAPWVEEHEVEDLRAFLRGRFPAWPATAGIYDLEGFDGLDRPARAAGTVVLSQRDVTPRDQAGVARLAELRGPVLVVVAPADPITAIIAVVAIAVGVAAAVLFTPKIPNAGANTIPSPNNSLSERSNTARPSSRIPEIFGQVRSTPDLLTVPYRRFVDNVEVETAFMCVGRGSYDLSDVRDGDTPFASIAGSSAAFYAPDGSPNTGAVPQLLIGDAIAERVSSVVAVNGVNGEVLKAPNGNNHRADGSIKFVAPDRIVLTDGSVDLTTLFSAGDDITVQGATFGLGIARSTVLANVIFHGDMSVEFVDQDPPTYAPGDRLDVFNAVFTYAPATGAPVTVDLTGSYYVLGTNGRRVYLSATPPGTALTGEDGQTITTEDGRPISTS